MSFALQQQEALTVLGISARASNAEPEAIGELWRRFQAMGSATAIEARRNDPVYSVYCEYESDFNGQYTVLIGCAVDAEAATPEGMRKIEIGVGKFAVFEAVGELPMSVWQAWADIWKTSFDRLYKADFDRYGEDGTVTVHVEVR